MSPHHNHGYHCRANDGQNYRKATLHALHTDAVDTAVKSHERNMVLDAPPICSSEKELTIKERSTLAQL